MIARTEAVVLKSMKYRETSKIVTLYTLAFGKVSVIAKGARDLRSKFGASLEPMTHITAVFYRKPHRDLHLLSHSDIIEQFRRIHSEYDRMTAGYAVVDLLQAVMHGEEEHPGIFNLVTSALRAIETGTKNIPNVFYWYELQLAGLLGFAMSFDACGVCGAPIREGSEQRLGFNPMTGSIVDEGCGGSDARWISCSLRSVRILQQFSRITPEAAMSIEAADESKREIERVLRGHFAAHVESTRRLRTTVFTGRSGGEGRGI